MKKIFTFLTFALFFAVNAHAIAPGATAPDFKIKDTNGKPQSVSQHKGKIIVLEWHNPECPYVQKFYAPGKMQELQQTAKADGIVWLTINSGAPGKQGHLTAASANELIASQNFASAAYIVDADGSIGKAYGAASTPTMVVIDDTGNVAYFGAIDDKPSAKSEDIATANNYVTQALAAVKAGSKPIVATTKAYGCGVKYAE